jgi:hypothetical protein
MPYLDNIEYSREDCIAAVRNYYGFLTAMYLKESEVVEPPEGGWPDITTDTLRGLGKTDEVISLLRHLPYINRGTKTDVEHAVPRCRFADWHTLARKIIDGRSQAEQIKSLTEGYYDENVPSHVIGLTIGGTIGGEDIPRFLLDTKLGIIHWPNCPGEIFYGPPVGDTFEGPAFETIIDDPYDYAPENEAEWRAEGGRWTIADFFETLKDQFRRLLFVPVSSIEVIDVYYDVPEDKEGMIPMLQGIYREHGWPDLERFQKKDCLRAIRRAMADRYPDYLISGNEYTDNT